MQLLPRRTLKILHVEAGRNLYGGAGQVVYLVRGLAARGVDNVLACPQGSAVAEAMGNSGKGWRTVQLRMKGDLDFGLVGRLTKLYSRAQAGRGAYSQSSRRRHDGRAGGQARWRARAAVAPR